MKTDAIKGQWSESLEVRCTKHVDRRPCPSSKRLSYTSVDVAPWRRARRFPPPRGLTVRFVPSKRFRFCPQTRIEFPHNSTVVLRTDAGSFAGGGWVRGDRRALLGVLHVLYTWRFDVERRATPEPLGRRSLVHKYAVYARINQSPLGSKSEMMTSNTVQISR